MKTIVYFDDDPDDIAIFEELIQEVDASIILRSYSDCVLGLQELEANVIKPDIIFLDINMPSLSGKEVLQRIRQFNNLAPVPVVMYSTTISNEDRKLLSQYGANDFLKKGSFIKEAQQGIAEITSKYFAPKNHIRL